MNLKEKKIVIVDDDKFVSELYKQHLLKQGYTSVDTCYDPVDALDYLLAEPKIIFLDYQMDTLNGFELLQKIKRFNPNILVVMISGQNDMNVAIESLKYGAFDYIEKGTNELKKIDEVLTRSETYLSSLANGQSTILKNIRSIFSKN